MASVVAMNVLGTVSTVSPGCTPAAISAKRKASVPLPTPTQCGVSQNSANSDSKSSTIGPPMNRALPSVARNTEINSSSNSRCTVTRSTSGMCPFVVVMGSLQLRRR